MFELAIVLALIVLNGVFALSELAIVSARKSRLRALAEEGRAGAAAALHLAQDSGRFLSSVQIGITLVGILAGAFSGAALGGRLADILAEWGMPVRFAQPLGFGLVIGLVTYLTLIVGELVPKQLALRNPEGVACTVAPMMRLVARIGAPVVWLLDRSTDLVLALLGKPADEPGGVSEEELRSLIGEAEVAGIIEEEERRMMTGVLRLGDRSVRGMMTPRAEVDWIDVDAGEAAARAVVRQTRHSRLPAGRGGPDNMLGVLQTRELLAAMLDGAPLDLPALVHEAPVIPDTMEALDALNVLRGAEVPMALVHDEYGHFEGIVTPADALEAIVGAFRSDAPMLEPAAVRREDGSWLLAGWMPADELSDIVGIRLPGRRDYQTVAGLVLAELQHLPETGERVDAHGWRFEVLDLDGRRIDKVLATPLSRRALEAP